MIFLFQRYKVTQFIDRKEMEILPAQMKDTVVGAGTYLNLADARQKSDYVELTSKRTMSIGDSWLGRESEEPEGRRDCGRPQSVTLTEGINFVMRVGLGAANVSCGRCASGGSRPVIFPIMTSQGR